MCDASIYNTLNAVRRVSERIDELETLRESKIARLLPSGIAYDSVKVQTSPDDPMLRAFEELDELEQTVLDLRNNEMPKAISTVMSMINTLDHSISRQVFIRLFISLERVPVIAEALAYTEDGIYRIRRRGLQELQKKKLSSGF